MRALYWWIDRWRQSSAYTDLTLEEQGAFRNLLDEAWLRGGALPRSPRAIAKASGDPNRWKKIKKNVMKRWEKRADGWHNSTLDKVLRDSGLRKARQDKWRLEHRLGDRLKEHSQDQDRSNATYLRAGSAGAARHSTVYAAIVHQVLNADRFESLADLTDAVKTAAAQHHVPYDGDQVAKAIRSVGSRRQLTVVPESGRARAGGAGGRSGGR